MLEFYVYAYIRSKDSTTAKAGTPYYIGKGKGYRYRNTHSVPIPKDPNFIVFLETNLSELGALALERRIIKWYGRKNIGTGILLNKTDGGDGVTGRKCPLRDKDYRAKISKAMKGRKWSNKVNQLKGRAGELNGNSKLTKDDVENIRRLKLERKLTNQQIADTYKISKSTIYLIQKNLLWKN